jgi:hypothetical protein
MSDISDVLSVLVDEVTAAVYPPVLFDAAAETFDSKEDFDVTRTDPVAAHKFNDGSKFNRGAKFDEKKAPSITGTPIVIYAGWPAEDELNEDLANGDTGRTHITVFPKAEERNTTRYQELEYVIAAPAPTLTMLITGAVLAPGQVLYDTPGVTWADTLTYDAAVLRDTLVTVGGTVSVPQNLALRVNGKFYTYAVQKDDTVAIIAAALEALVGHDIAGTSVSGSAITIGPTGRLQAARVGGFGTVGTEVRRQERVIQISVWANDPELRDKIAAGVDVVLAQKRFLDMPDGFAARLIYKNSMVIDATQKANLYRRDLNYLVEYATTTSDQVAAVIAPGINLNGLSVTV